jgi:hypothetical protein
MKRDFVETFKATFKYPFHRAKRPQMGTNDLLAEGFMSTQIELRAQGNGLLNGREAEFIDVRVYIQPKPVLGNKLQVFMVKGDHPTFKRPDKKVDGYELAIGYADELRKAGYENISVAPVK